MSVCTKTRILFFNIEFKAIAVTCLTFHWRKKIRVDMQKAFPSNNLAHIQSFQYVSLLMLHHHWYTGWLCQEKRIEFDNLLLFTPILRGQIFQLCLYVAILVWIFFTLKLDRRTYLLSLLRNNTWGECPLKYARKALSCWEKSFYTVKRIYVQIDTSFEKSYNYLIWTTFQFLLVALRIFHTEVLLVTN